MVECAGNADVFSISVWRSVGVVSKDEVLMDAVSASQEQRTRLDFGCDANMKPKVMI